MIEITLRECRFGGSKNALIIHSHSVPNHFIGIETKLRDANVG